MTGLSNAPVTPKVTSTKFNQAAQSRFSTGLATGAYGTASSEITTSTVSFPIDTPKYIMTFQIFNYSRADLNYVGTITQASGYPAIILPLPSNLIDSNHVDWQEVSAGLLGGAIVNTVGQGLQGNATGAVGSALTAGAAGLPTLLGQIAAKNTAASVGSAVAGQIGAAATQGVQALMGISPNQFMTLLFRGPTFKGHKFTWDLAPTSYTEADALRRIIKFFKMAMAPNFYTATTGSGPVLWQFPKIFQIGLYPNSLFMYKFKPCVCDYFVVNYTPGGRAAFHWNAANTDGGNSPEAVQIQASFRELEFWTEGNYNDSNDPQDVEGGNTGAGTISNLINNTFNPYQTQSGH